MKNDTFLMYANNLRAVTKKGGMCWIVGAHYSGIKRTK